MNTKLAVLRVLVWLSQQGRRGPIQPATQQLALLR